MSDFLVLSKVETEFRPLLLDGDADAVASAIADWIESGLTAKVVRGRKMRSLRGLFDEFAAAFQFPLYFGENKDAFNECIGELENLPAGVGYVVTITEPDKVLVDAEAELGWLMHSLEIAAGEWRKPVELGEWWDRPAVPFHVVLVGDRDAIEMAARRWSSAGARLLPFGDDSRKSGTAR